MQTLQGLTCLRIKANHSPTIVASYPEFAFCINAHPIRNVLLFFHFVYTPTVACKVEEVQLRDALFQCITHAPHLE